MTKFLKITQQEFDALNNASPLIDVAITPTSEEESSSLRINFKKIEPENIRPDVRGTKLYQVATSADGLKLELFKNVLSYSPMIGRSSKQNFSTIAIVGAMIGDKPLPPGITYGDLYLMVLGISSAYTSPEALSQLQNLSSVFYEQQENSKK